MSETMNESACECQIAGMCSRRSVRVPEIHWKKCQSGQVTAIDRLYLDPPAPPAVAKRHGRRVMRTGYGDALAEIIARETGEQVDCTGCQNEIATLNIMTHAQVFSQIEALAYRIRSRAQLHARTWWQRWGCALAPSVVEDRIKQWILDAISTSPQSPNPATNRKYNERKVAVIPDRSKGRTMPSKPKKQWRRGAFAMGTDKPRWISAAQFANDVRDFAAQVPSGITAIAGVARSGLSAATMLSMYLHLPLLVIRQTLNDVIEAGNGWRLGGSSHVKPHGRVLVVDDTCMTGNSFKQVLPIMKDWSCTTAAIYCNPAANVKPDMWHSELQWPHMLEWNVFNSVLSPNMALDFDGILCYDPARWQDDDGQHYREFILNAKPLYLPRKVPVPLIVTARIEKYRAETMQWLERHKIKVHQLVMHPAASTRDRERDNISAYKAKHFAAWAKNHRPRPAPLMFVESDPRQAESIFQQTNHMVVCPGASKVWS